MMRNSKIILTFLVLLTFCTTSKSASSRSFAEQYLVPDGEFPNLFRLSFGGFVVGDGGYGNGIGIQNDYGLSVVGISKSTLRLLESDANGTDGRAYYEVNYNGYYIWIPYTDTFLFSQEIDSIKQSNKNKYGHSFKVVKTDRGTVRGITFFPKFLRRDGGNFFAFGVQIGAVDYNFNIQYPTYTGKLSDTGVAEIREISNKGYFWGFKWNFFF